MKLLIKFPSRQRPQRFLDTLENYALGAKNIKDIHFLFSFDDDDLYMDFEVEDEIKILCAGAASVTIKNGVSKCKIHACNRDVNEFTPPWDILLLASDDMEPIVTGYDDIIRQQFADGNLDRFVWFNDGNQNEICTLPVMGYNYYMRTKYIYHPAYKSLFADKEQTAVAQALGLLVKVEDCIIKHQHHTFNKGIVKDELDMLNDKHWKADQQTYKQRKQNNFDLK